MLIRELLQEYITKSPLDEVTIDNKNGWGSVPLNQDVDYFGLRTQMKPSVFLALAVPLGQDHSTKIEQHIASGGAIGAPFLYITVPEEWDNGDFSKPAKVSGHEGRNRMSIVKKLEGDAPVEVHLFLRGGLRARDLTPEFIKHINAGLIHEGGHRFISGPLFITELQESEQYAKSGTMTLWHGGNLNDNLGLISQKTGRFEYGSGLYTTTHYDTARKYSKGSRKLYQITLAKGVSANDAMIDYAAALNFVDSVVIRNKRAEVKSRMERFKREDSIPAYIFNNIILNETAITATNTRKLSQFLVDQGVDYLLVPNAFGWGEMVVVIFNMNKILNIRQIKPNDKIDVFDLPTDFVA